MKSHNWEQRIGVENEGKKKTKDHRNKEQATTKQQNL
jgi:hypothetical protein